MLNRELFFTYLAQTSDFPQGISISYGKEEFLYDTDGKEHIDFISGISVSSYGHNNPIIIEAVQHQLALHTHTMVYGEFIQNSQVRLASKLAELLPDALQNVFFTNSGSEAVEGAMKLTKRYTGRHQMISCFNAYHGSTQGALSIMGNENQKRAFHPLLPEVEFIHFNNIQDIEKISEQTAGVFIEPIQGEAGIIPATKDFLIHLRKKCSETGTLLVFDESQTGMGRTGKMFAFEHYGVFPDILILSKALGGGFPLGAFISSKQIMSVLKENPVLGHITTFGGHPVSCAAALAGIEILESENFFTNIIKKENIIRSEFTNIKGNGSLRGMGLLFALQLDSEDICQKIIRNCLSDGVITDWFLFAPDCLRIAPPLNITDENIVKAINIIKKNITSTI